MHPWTEIRRLVLTKQKRKRVICQQYDLHWKTLDKILNHAEPPGYRQRRPKPRLDPYLSTIHEILEQDKTSPPKNSGIRSSGSSIGCGRSMVTRAGLPSAATRCEPGAPARVQGAHRYLRLSRAHRGLQDFDRELTSYPPALADSRKASRGALRFCNAAR